MSININNETFTTLSDLMNNPSVVSPEIKAEVEYETEQIVKNSDELFYSKSNLAHLEKSIEQLNSGKASVHELIEDDISDNDVESTDVAITCFP